ncbi:MAG: hypothetical protein COW01_09325 [Bdellovibrionales bacterium CG12_big_fil_rev_8_21_14_0_65_38_15]|nr:MAG: hypothetical protein COW79_09330 [Bdellovibrionales bacterium CG22_combo_CG10-13_8_21_14_all_38_13]PIQ54728.1 MAG: hypothetical protein COW01_09325 [Bdellovibrionales bacterium CG12_big_fil_rev_8_21_14_0_65_38_15]PIR30876.1 MAG: hypothetical protein COV38_03510 [Bdellovibrionales bacterium CG11_big_fil_rev_8_21_14_0_20_38_13]
MIANIKKFKLLQDKEDSLVEGLGVTMLINLAHLVSVKPINVATQAGVVQAYWIRLSNGKKYKATEIPEELSELLKNDVMNFAQLNGSEIDSINDVH